MELMEAVVSGVDTGTSEDEPVLGTRTSGAVS